MSESEEIVVQSEPTYLVAEGQPTLLVDGAAIQTHDAMTHLLLFKVETFYSSKAEKPDATVKLQSFCQGRFAFTPTSFMVFADLIEKHKAKMISQLTAATDQVVDDPEVKQNG